MGIGLAGLSFLDPAVADHPELLGSLLFCTIVGSNAPDVDYLYKYKGNETYVKKHRGVSHSLYSQGILSFLIASIAAAGTGGSYFLTFLLWTTLAVMLHVLFDVCNIYGTQALLPFSKKWIAINILPIFDPIITFLHIVGILLWIIGFQSGIVFSIVYLIVFTYMVFRYYEHRKVIKELHRQGERDVTYTLLPTFRWNVWGIIANDHEKYRLGKYANKQITWSKVLKKESDKNEIIQASRNHSFIDYLMLHSSFMHAKIIQTEDGYEVHWYDLRYQWKIDEPFIAIIQLDKKLNLINSMVKRGLLTIPERS